MVKLKRALSLTEVSISGIGIILGAGIYALVGKAAGLAGNTVWLSFLVAAALAALTGLGYAELSSMHPKAAAEYVYTRKAFGKRISFLTGWILIIAGIVSGAAVALGFAGYFVAIFSLNYIIPVAIILIGILSFVLFYGIKQSAWFAIIFTFIEVIGLFIIIAIGLPHFGSVNYLDFSMGFSGVLAAGALIFFAFIGFDDIVNLAEETKKPRKTIPRAVIIAVVFSAIIYILVAISAISVIDWQTLGQSDSPLADVAAQAFGNDAFLLLSVIALFSTANTVLLLLLATTRMTYGMARNEVIPKRLSRLHSVRRTPWVATLIVMIIAMLFVTIGAIEIVANITNFCIFVAFILVNLSVIYLRRKEPDVHRSFKIPGSIKNVPIISVLGAVVSFVLLLSVGWEIILFGVILLIVGLILFEFTPKK